MAKEPVFVVGTGRCGTQTIAHLFKQLPSVYSVHEGEPELARVAGFRLAGEDYDAQRTITHARKPKIDSVDHYFESSLWNTWLISDYVAMWPQAKFIWLTRFPLTWARSAYRRGWYYPDSEATVGAYKYLRPEPSGGWPPGVDRWFKLGYMWKKYTTHIVNTLSSLDVPWVHVDMNDLNKLEVVNSLVTWCEFPGTVTQTTRENGSEKRITLEEIEKRGLRKKFDDSGFRVATGSHPYSWTDLKLAQEKTGMGEELQYECIYDFTPELVNSFQAGTCYV